MADLADILLVEDNPGDIRLLKEALEHEEMDCQLHVTKTGEGALDFIFKNGRYSDCPTPDLVLLDLNLPGKGGFDVLKEIKKKKSTRAIPVLILSSSREDDSVLKSYNLHANSYIQKPADINQIYQVVHSIRKFWFEVTRLPLRRG